MFGSNVAFDSLYGRLPMTTRGRYSDLTNTNRNVFTETVVSIKRGVVSVRPDVSIYSLKTNIAAIQ